MTESNPYAAVLRDLRARRAKIDEAIAVIEAMAGESGLGDAGPAQTEIRPDTFFNLSVPKAVVKYLGMTNRTPKAPQDIVSALEQGGQTQANYMNVYSALKRLRRSGEMQKLPSGEWGLSDWYPNAKRPTKRPNGGGAEAADGGDEHGGEE